MNGINALRKLFGLVPMNDEPGQGGGSTPPAAPATDAPAATPESSSLLGGEPPAAEPPAATDAPSEGEEGDKPKGGEEGDTDKEKAAEGAPEAYAEFTLPEGFEVDEEVLGDLHEVFKGLDLPQDKAQELLGRLMQIQEKQLGTPEQQLERAEKQIIDLNTRYAEECRNLPEIGGENFAKSLALASKVIQTFGTPELRSLTALTGVGSHPEYFKMMVAIGSKMAPDTFEHGGEESKGEVSASQLMFGHLFKDQ